MAFYKAAKNPVLVTKPVCKAAEQTAEASVGWGAGYTSAHCSQHMLCPCSRAPALCICYRSKKSAFFLLGLTGRTGTALSWGGRAWRDAPGCPLLPFGVLRMHAGTCLQALACSHTSMACTCMCLYVSLCVHRKAGCNPGVQQQMQRAGNEPGRKSRRAGNLAVFRCSSSIFHARGARWGTGG